MNFLKLAIVSAVLVGCNWGLVDVQEKERVCYDRKFVIKKDTSYIDSIPFKCGTTKITTPFDDLIKHGPF